MCKLSLLLVNSHLITLQYVRYVELSLRFQDTILGHLFGVSDSFRVLDRDVYGLLAPSI